MAKRTASGTPARTRPAKAPGHPGVTGPPASQQSRLTRSHTAAIAFTLAASATGLGLILSQPGPRHPLASEARLPPTGPARTQPAPSSSSSPAGPARTRHAPGHAAGGTSPAPRPPAATRSPAPSPTPSASRTPTPRAPRTPPAGGCTLTSSVVKSWAGGYRVQFTVTDSGNAPISGWAAGFSFADSADRITNSWNAAIAKSGTAVTASNESYNGAIGVGGSTTWGMVVTGTNSALSGLSCTPA